MESTMFLTVSTQWHFDFDKAIAEINVGNKTKKNV